MAGPSGMTTGLDTTFYFAYLTDFDVPATHTWGDYVGAGKLVLPANELINAKGDVEIGIEAASNSESFFGKALKSEYAVPGDPSNTEVMVSYDDDNDVHKKVFDFSKVGTACWLAAVVMTATAEQLAVICRGELKGTKIQLSPENRTTVPVPVAILEAPTVIRQA